MSNKVKLINLVDSFAKTKKEAEKLTTKASENQEREHQELEARPTPTT